MRETDTHMGACSVFPVALGRDQAPAHCTGKTGTRMGARTTVSLIAYHVVFSPKATHCTYRASTLKWS